MGLSNPWPSERRVSASTRLSSRLDAPTFDSQPGAQLRLTEMNMWVRLRSEAVTQSLWGSLHVRGSARDPGDSGRCVHGVRSHRRDKEGAGPRAPRARSPEFPSPPRSDVAAPTSLPVACDE